MAFGLVGRPAAALFVALLCYGERSFPREALWGGARDGEGACDNSLARACVCIYVCMYSERERERKKERKLFFPDANGRAYIEGKGRGLRLPLPSFPLLLPICELVSFLPWEKKEK